MRLLYSAAAIADLGRLRAFIAEHDPAASLRIVNALIERIESLSHFPAMGRVLDEAPKALAVREFAFGAYAVRYMATTEALVVLRIWHHREEGRSAR